MVVVGVVPRTVCGGTSVEGAHPECCCVYPAKEFGEWKIAYPGALNP